MIVQKDLKVWEIPLIGLEADHLFDLLLVELLDELGREISVVLFVKVKLDLDYVDRALFGPGLEEFELFFGQFHL